MNTTINNVIPSDLDLFYLEIESELKVYSDRARLQPFHDQIMNEMRSTLDKEKRTQQRRSQQQQQQQRKLKDSSAYRTPLKCLESKKGNSESSTQKVPSIITRFPKHPRASQPPPLLKQVPGTLSALDEKFLQVQENIRMTDVILKSRKFGRSTD